MLARIHVTPAASHKFDIEAGPEFARVLREQMDQLIELQNTAEQAQQDLLAGRSENVLEVVMAVQQADIALNFAIELRNKVIESYMEISRMQI